MDQRYVRLEIFFPYFSAMRTNGVAGKMYEAERKTLHALDIPFSFFSLFLLLSFFFCFFTSGWKLGGVSRSPSFLKNVPRYLKPRSLVLKFFPRLQQRRNCLRREHLFLTERARRRVKSFPP